MARSVLYGSSPRLLDVNAGQGSLESVAEDVAIHRGRVVTEALFHMAAIRSLQTKPDLGERAAVTCVAAKVQVSTAKQGQQAAHLLPGQIKVGAHYVWDLAAHPDQRIAGEVFRLKQQTQLCFAWVNVLPASFNKADSEAEGTGGESPADRLKPLFGDVVQTMWRSARVDKSQPLTIDRNTTLVALGDWFRRVTGVYNDAAGRKAARGFADEARVLSTYARSFNVANPARFVASQAGHLWTRYPSFV